MGEGDLCGTADVDGHGAGVALEEGIKKLTSCLFRGGSLAAGLDKLLRRADDCVTEDCKHLRLLQQRLDQFLFPRSLCQRDASEEL